MTENSDFATKLFAIRPFKETDSLSSSDQKQTELQSKVNEPKGLPTFQIPQPSHFLEDIANLRKVNSEQPHIHSLSFGESNKKTFMSISSTIDILFSKIEKIKEQFSFAMTKPHSQSEINMLGRDQHKEFYSQTSIGVSLDNNKENLDPVEEISTKNEKVCQQPKQKTQSLKVLEDQDYNKANIQPSFKQSFQNKSQNIEQKLENQGDLFTSWDMGLQPQPRLNIRDFQLGKCIGSGKFGDVYISIHKKTGFLCAIKKVFKSTIKDYQMQDQFAKQLRIHYSLDHPNIVKLYSHFQDQYHIFLLIQLAPHNSLIDRLVMNQVETAKAIDQVCSALSYLHKSNIIHRDIKPQNVVVSMDVVKVCDFGWAAYDNGSIQNIFCGTLDYVSPEMKDVGQYNNSVDLWSVGVLTFELLAGFPPFKQEISNWKMMGSKRKHKWSWDVLYPPEISDKAQQFIGKLLKIEPSERVSLEECQMSNFIKQGQTKEQNVELSSELLQLFQ